MVTIDNPTSQQPHVDRVMLDDDILEISVTEDVSKLMPESSPCKKTNQTVTTNVIPTENWEVVEEAAHSTKLDEEIRKAEEEYEKQKSLPLDTQLRLLGNSGTCLRCYEVG